MKEITIPILWAVAQEMLGGLLWLALAALVLMIVLYVVAARRSGTLGAAIAAGRGPAIGLGLLAGVAFAALLPAYTLSSWSYVSGATDYVVILGGAIAAAIGVAVFVLPVMSLMRRG